MIALVLFGTFFALLLLGVPVAFALGLSAAAALVALGGLGDLSIVPSVFYASVAAETLLAIPFFILTGVLMIQAGISKRLVEFAHACVGGRKHGLAFVVIVATFFFSAISGSGPATVAAIGSILIPALIRHGYQSRHATSLMATAGSMGIILPPSITFIIFAVIVSDFAGVSIARLFMAGVVPGIMLAVALMIACLFLPRGRAAADRALETVGVRQGEAAGGSVPGSTGGAYADAAAADGDVRLDEAPVGMGKAFVRALPGLLVPLIILGGIYSGLVTPTESGIASSCYALLVGLFVYRELRVDALPKVFVTAALQTSAVMVIVGSASVFAYVVTSNQLAASVADLLFSITENRALIMLVAIVILLLIGAFIDAVSALYLLVPIIAPVLLAVGVDVTTIGVMMTVSLAIGLITPPIGINLFVAAGIARVSLSEVLSGIRPFLVAGLVVLFVVAYVPAVSNWLPDLLGF